MSLNSLRSAVQKSNSDKSNTRSVEAVICSLLKERQPQAKQFREVGDQATWSLSSCKSGFGVEQLRDCNTDTYWQSDGQLPHLVNVQFRRKTTVSDVQLYTDIRLDESYTPAKISVRCGTNFNDLQEVVVHDLVEPTGWQTIKLTSNDLGQSKPVRTFMIQIAVVANHHQGRDTHLRQIRIHSPVKCGHVSTIYNAPDNSLLLADDAFASIDADVFATALQWKRVDVHQFTHIR